MNSPFNARTWYWLSLLIAPSLLLAACATNINNSLDNFDIVDCEIPGQVLRIGSGYSTTGRSHALRTNGSDCAIRGGYYVQASAANYATSLKVWQPLADTGDMQAQYYVGRIYDNGLGRAQDPVLASAWYRKAAAQGHTASLTALAALYEKGSIDGKPNLVQALDMYRQAAKLTEPLAFAKDVRARELDVELLKREIGSFKKEAERQMDTLRRQIESRNSEVKRLQQEARRISATTTPAQNIVPVQNGTSRAEHELQEILLKLKRIQSDAQLAQVASDSIDRPLVTPANPDDPRIELIEPRTTVMRGLMTVGVANGVGDVAIVAKVEAPATLSTVLINDQVVALEANGHVRSRVSLRGSTTPVQIVATDMRGRRATLTFVIVTDAVLKTQQYTPNTATFGNYYALVIGNNRYREWDALNSPRNDATAVASVLRNRYGFNVQTLFDATRQDVIREFSRLRNTLTSRDNLLVYYAGHGFWDGANQRGYWIPVDGGKTSPANWISSTDITDQLSVVHAKQVLVVADSCYSGVLVGSVATQLDRVEGNKAEWLVRRAQMRSRKVMSSGSVAQVMDGGAGNNSIFARQLINALSVRTEPFEAHELYREIAPRVEQAARGSGVQQEPQFGPMRHAGHEAGDFVFLPKS